MIKKRLYLGLLAATMLFFGGLAAYIWLTYFQGSADYIRYIIYLAAAVFFAALAIIGLGFTGIVISLIAEKDIAFLNKAMNFTFCLLYPAVIRLGKVFKIAQDKIQSSFVEVNNQLVRVKRGRVAPERLMVLLPHCLQNRNCVNRITINPGNCRECGACGVGSLLKLCRRYGVYLNIATGGTLARDMVKKIRPQAIIAVACERDLTSGILDCIPLPVLGITNDRPYGPCYNTDVDLTKVEKAILFFTQGGENHANALVR